VASLKRVQRYLQFTSPEKVEVVTRELSPPGKGELLVETSLSAVSAGTETLIFRGLFPEGESRDSNIPALSGTFDYPFQFGYSTVGKVVEAGSAENGHWAGRRVFAFQPHANGFLIPPGELMPLPENLTDDDAVFLPNMETSINLVMDGAPILGEKVAIIGLGVVGLLTSSLIRQFPLDKVTLIDLLPFRRSQVIETGQEAACSPEDALKNKPAEGYDLIFELTGNPSGLNLAMELAGFETRIIVGSWYGKKQGSVDLGGKFHRNRVKLISSQVSTISSQFSGRWSKERRFSNVFRQLKLINPSKWITHRFPLEEAMAAYQRLTHEPEDMLQVVFTY
jgi:2-desacetyl-2-hydroxyethyl bacteriochlorophyllide A dehydrogenase